MGEQQIDEVRVGNLASGPTSGVFDQAAALARVEGDAELLTELVTLFLEDYPRQLAAIRGALATGDAQALTKHAHTLKGSVGNFAAPEAFEAARQLELAGREGNLIRGETACRVLESALERLAHVLISLTH